LCGCGKELLTHDIDSNKKSHNVMKSENYLKEWKKETCTSPDGYTDAFGECRFLGYNDNIAKYCRIHYDTDMEIILKLLFDSEYWNLRRPRLIISVTGGAKITLKKSLRDKFSKGLVKVATTTNAIITSGGSYSGCMKIIGEAFKDNAFSIDNKIPLIGIRNWGSVTNNYKLINVKFFFQLSNFFVK